MTKQEEYRLKKDFEIFFIKDMQKEGFIEFFYNVFMKGTAYVVGGYLRDFITGNKARDIDVIVDIKNEVLFEILKELRVEPETNRHGGVKVTLPSMQADIWSLENNWAFKNKLVKLNENDTLNSIAKGCFYNYDSLVINLNNFNFNLRYYKDFVEGKKLDILQERTEYKHLNPSIEANILRAFYIKSRHKIEYTNNTAKYLLSKIGHLWDKYGDPVDRLLKIKEKYPKYEVIDRKYIEEGILDLRKHPASSYDTRLFKY